jgi:hypothetical protein
MPVPDAVKLTPEELVTTILQTHEKGYEVVSIKFSSNGKLIATQDLDGVIRVWNVINGKCCLSKLDVHGFFTLSPEDNFLVVEKRFLTDDRRYQSYIELWNLKSVQCVSMIDCGEHRIEAIAFCSDSNFMMIKGHADRIRLWDVKNNFDVSDIYDVNANDFERWQAKKPADIIIIFFENIYDQIRAEMIAFIQNAREMNARRREMINNEILALAQAMCLRLGVDSSAQTLNPYVLRLIYELLESDDR